jgi:serine/threonine protein phosphatase PrpC
MEQLVGDHDSLQAACEALVAAANDGGGPDNITVLMLQVDVA